ncbi:MAG: response regulator transcription factor [Cytophagaceae bacterium]|jgi:DNA-binding NarL/FixJ family response regulator|nr:response regulator transcription factor [Cytophagaceae bacterium]
MIRILLADDHGIFRKGVKSLLEEESDLMIVAEAESGTQALEKVRDMVPDIVLMDITMPNMNGIEATIRITREFRSVKVIMLSMHDNEDYILQSVESGAYGYLLKDTTKEEMLKALRTVATGEKYFNSEVSKAIVNGYLVKKKAGERVEGEGFGLSKKERRILKYIVDGLSSREIAEQLELSIRTVDNHRAIMMRKMNVKNAAEMVKIAFEKKIF